MPKRSTIIQDPRPHTPQSGLDMLQAMFRGDWKSVSRGLSLDPGLGPTEIAPPIIGMATSLKAPKLLEDLINLRKGFAARSGKISHLESMETHRIGADQLFGKDKGYSGLSKLIRNGDVARIQGSNIEADIEFLNSPFGKDLVYSRTGFNPKDIRLDVWKNGNYYRSLTLDPQGVAETGGDIMHLRDLVTGKLVRSLLNE